MKIALRCKGQKEKMIIGLDEVGYGPLAGPLVVAAVAGVAFLPLRVKQALDDSKNLTAARRESLAADLANHEAVHIVVVEGSVAEIEANNILAVNHQAMVRAVADLCQKMGVRHMALTDKDNDNDQQKTATVLVDGKHLPKLWLQGGLAARPIVGGDGLYASIAAASIVAKVYRDNLMVRYHHQYPQYNFAQHKGYGTQYHRDMIKKHGPCPLHRHSFLGNILAS